MIRSPRLLRAVRRANAVSILVASLLVCAAAIVVMIATAREAARERAPHDSMRREPEVLKGEVFELGSMTRLRGTPVLLLELTSRQRYSSGAYSGEAASVRNLLFYDTETSKSTWLFTQYGLLTGVRPLAEHGDDKARIRWVLLEAIAQDTNRDGRLSLQDAHTLGVVDADGQNYKDLVPGVLHVLGVEFLSDTAVAIALSEADADYMVEVDLPRREVRKRTLLRYHQRP